ncbi:P-loop containing nucleoside triphosphate hydrolase protein, partial [Gaertneriomyces semiglobifer]
MLTSPTSGHSLRPYQLECIELTLKGIEEGKTRQIASLPVGSGKTTVFANLIPRIPCPTPRATKTMVLAHRTELLQQALKTLCREAPFLKVDVDCASKRASMDADVVIASVGTLGRAVGGISERLRRYDPAQFKAIIIDEAHHASAASYRRILAHFQADEPGTPIIVWGCSATVRRHDGISLGTTFDHIVYHRTVSDMILEDWLCDLRLEVVQTDTSLDGVPIRSGDFAPEKLADAIDNPQRNSLVVGVYKDVKERHGRQSTLVFASNVRHIESLVDTFKANGIDAVGVHSGTSDYLRRQILDDFRQMKFPVLVNCGIVTEGVDIPVIDCLILARPTASSVLLQQMIGRGLRKYPKKDYCLAVDLSDSTSRKDNCLVTIPTLMGLDPRFDFEGR